ncbi:MAG TPA: alpha-amylase family glycosyl hydrolase [Bacteroidota bacterium]|nr:alpha-amylase family glycosyl hydrolase [Bacteroidota bacterium]
MKKIYCVLFFLAASSLLAQSVPVTFHYRPVNKNFTVLRLVGTMNGWNNADNAMTMTDANGDGEYELTIPLTAGTEYNYKFCMDGNWGLAYGDPDNPRINTSDNDNSQILVKDPMIVYLLPRDKDTKNRVYTDTSKSGLPIRVIIASSADKPVDPATLQVTVDGVAITNPAQYYNSTKKEFTYKPSPMLSPGEHSLSASITSAAGTDSKSSTFTRNPNQKTYKVPVDFFYDANNRSVGYTQTLTDVAVVGTFNNWNDTFNPMTNRQGNGVWETTVWLEPDSIEYKIKLNKTAWINDPDMPSINPGSGNNQMAVVADSTPTIRLLAPLENQTFARDTTVAFQFLLRPGAASKGVDSTSFVVKYDGNAIVSTYHADSTLTCVVTIAGEGRHTVDAAFTNKEGATSHQTFSFGVSAPSKGIFQVDGIGDEQYTYPPGVAAGAADILSVSIQDTPKHDSLKFTIRMNAIDQRTRIALLIANPVSGTTSAPRQLDVRLPDWDGQGVFASIGAPGNSYHNAAIENRFMISNNPPAYSADTIPVNQNAMAVKSFEFTVSLAFLGQYLGPWNDQREFCVVSYLAATDKSGNAFEVGTAEHGSASDDDPDIYDAAFIRSTFWQQRILNNYLPSGTRTVSLDGPGRGLLSLTARQISDSLASKSLFVTFLTPGLIDYWYSNVTLHGTVNDTTLTTLLLVKNGTVSTQSLTRGKFSIPLVLTEGANSVFIKVIDAKGDTSTSKELVLNYTPDKQPVVHISGSAAGRTITLTAAATSPVGSSLAYQWKASAKNPAPVEIASTTNSLAFALPKTDGQYLFTAIVTDGNHFDASAEIAVKAKGDSITVAQPEDNYHPDWVDSAIVYEIFPRSFSQQGGFNGVKDNIARIKSLGANTVWLMPVFEGPTTHGYETTDYYAVESDYGSLADMTSMLSALHKNGLRVILDLVINHTGVTHPFMQNVFKYKEYSPYANFYIWSGAPGTSAFQFFFDWSSLPNINYENPDAKKYFLDVSRYWAQKSEIDGYRCDVAWGIEQRTPTFWNEWRREVKTANADVFLLAEASSADTAFYQKKFDAAYDWDLRTVMLGALNGSNKLGDVHRLVTRAYRGFARPFRFIENHDESRAASMFDTRRSRLLHTMIFTLNGIPLVYSGGEVGETTQRGLINWSDPDTLKPYFKRLAEIRKAYVFNPLITRIQNSDTATVYSYASISGTKTLVTAANFKNASSTVSLDLSALPHDGTSTYYLTDLFTGAVISIPPTQSAPVSVSLAGYQARVFYYGVASVPVSVAAQEPTGAPHEMVLEQNYPNPFNPSTTLRYGLPVSSRVRLTIYNVLGQEVAEVVNGEQAAGWHTQVWNAPVSSGMYFYRIEAVGLNAPHKHSVEVKKMLLVR